VDKAFNTTSKLEIKNWFDKGSFEIHHAFGLVDFLLPEDRSSGLIDTESLYIQAGVAG
jgi:hypothetical protein